MGLQQETMNIIIRSRYSILNTACIDNGDLQLNRTAYSAIFSGTVFPLNFSCSLGTGITVRTCRARGRSQGTESLYRSGLRNRMLLRSHIFYGSANYTFARNDTTLSNSQGHAAVNVHELTRVLYWAPEHWTLGRIHIPLEFLMSGPGGSIVFKT